jgi:hypothetical protein
MALSFHQLEAKLGLELSYPPVEIEHTYLEHLLRVEHRLETTQLWTAKLYEGVNDSDLARLETQGKSLIFASGRTAYFADANTATYLAEQVYRHPSDAISYGSLPVSDAQASTVKAGNAQLLIVDDEATQRLNPKLEEQILQQADSSVNREVLANIAAKLGDCYMLVSPTLASAVEAQPNTPFQFRAGAPGLPGMFKGTCRSSQWCQALGVDAIVPLSSTKGHGKTIQPGLYEVGDFFLARKSDAQLREQKLGIQALVNLPEGTLAEILPQLQGEAEHLAKIQQDPRQLVQRYLQTAERRLQQINNSDSTLEHQSAQVDWLYEILKGDATYQLLQHDRVQAKLEDFLAGEWQDIATGGVYVPQAMAQPHPDLRPGEVCIPSMLHGERIAIYRSPVANVAAFDVCLNNVRTIQQRDPEAFAQQGVCYLNPEDAKRLVIDFDGDTVALIREQEFPVLVQEIQDKNSLGQKPIQVQKEPKIPRPWPQGQTYWDALSNAAIDAANNQVGLVANQGMTIESLRQEITYLPNELKVTHFKEIANHWQKLLNTAAERQLQIPTNTKLQQDNFAPYDFTSQILRVVQAARTLAKLPPELQQQTAEAYLAQVQQIMFQAQSLVAVNLQRAVDAPKSARKIDQQYQAFAKALVGYKIHEVMLNKKAENLYRGSKVIPSNTCDPIGLMVKQANQYFSQAQLPVQERKQFKHFFPEVSSAQFLEAKAFTELYNQLIRQANHHQEQSKTANEPRLRITSVTSGRQIEISALLKFDPQLALPIWKVLREGNNLDIFIIRNPSKSPKFSEEYLAQAAIEGKTYSIGTVAAKVLEVQGHHLADSQRATILNAKVEALPSTDMELAKQSFKQANCLLENFVAAVPPSEKSQVAAYLWHNGGQAVCLKAFPEEVVKQLQTQTIDLSVVGLQYPTNQLSDRRWLGDESVPIRIQIDNDPNSPNYGRAIMQAMTWRTLGPVSEEHISKLPIGTSANAVIAEEGTNVKITTLYANELVIQKVNHYDLANQTWNGNTSNLKLFRETNRVIAKVELNGQWQRLGELDHASVAKIQQAQQQLGVTIIDGKRTFKGVQIDPIIKSAKIQVEPQSLAYPQRWVTAAQQQSKTATPVSRSQPTADQSGPLTPAKILQTEYLWAPEALSQYLMPGKTYDYITYQRVATPPATRPVQRIPMYFTAEIMAKATGIQQSIRPGCEFSDTFSAIAADKRTSTLRQSGQVTAKVGDIVEFTGKPGQQIFARITGRESFTVPPQGLDFTQVSWSLQTPPAIAANNASQLIAFSDRSTSQPESKQALPIDPGQLWQHYASRQPNGIHASTTMQAVSSAALRDGIEVKLLAEMLLQSPIMQSFESSRGQAEAQTAVHQIVKAAALPVFETAIAAGNLLQYKNCPEKPNGTREYDGQFWLVRNTLLIANKADGRTILQLQDGRLKYAPQAHDRDRLDFLVKNFGQAQWQRATQQTDFSQRRGLR